MDSLRRTARLIGSGFLLSNVTFIIGTIVLVEAVLAGVDYLTQVPAARPQIAVGVLLSFVNGLAYVGIAVLFYPVLKQRFESLALAYVGFRLVEFILQIVADVTPLGLLHLAAPSADTGSALLAARFGAFQMLNLIFSLSALILYFMLFRTRLVPAWLSVWGLIAAALVLLSTLTGWFDPVLGDSIGAITGLPMLLNELFLGVWLIARGFERSPML